MRLSSTKCTLMWLSSILIWTKTAAAQSPQLDTAHTVEITHSTHTVHPAGGGRSQQQDSMLEPLQLESFPLEHLQLEDLQSGFAEGEGLLDGNLDEYAAQSTQFGRLVGADPALLRSHCSRLPDAARIDLNRADRRTLEAFGLWSTGQVAALLEHRHRFGPLDRLEELQAIPALAHTELLRAAEACLYLSGADRGTEAWYRVGFGGSHRLLWRMEWGLQAPKAYRDSLKPYGGKRSRQVVQYRYRHERLEYGWTLEKDAGERWWQRRSKPGLAGPDFNSAFVHWRQYGQGQKRLQLMDLLVGDYAMRFGQGLVHWSSFGMGKGSETVALVRSASPIQRYGGLDENRFLRGAALRAAKGPWRASVFASRKRLDANGSDSSGYTSLRSDGYHRTALELESKDALGEQLFGAMLQWEGHAGQAGLLFSHQRYSHALIPEPRLDNASAFRGRDASHAALHFRHLVGNAQAFGEAALFNGRAEALILGWQTSLHPTLDATLLWRHFDTAYHAAYAMAFAEGSSPRNEQGAYLGLRWSPNPRWVLDAFVDGYRSPWLRYLVDAPSRGWETRAVLRWKPKRHAELQGRLRWERKMETSARWIAPENGAMSPLPPGLEEGLQWSDRVGVRIHLLWPIDASWRWQSRVEAVGAREQALEPFGTTGPVQRFRWGWGLYQDLRWAPLGSPFRVHVRAMLFRTADYDTRIYAYENDVLGAFSIPFYQGKGQRTYVLLRWRLNKAMDLYARFAATRYADQSAIGEGADQTEGPVRHQLKTLLRLRW